MPDPVVYPLSAVTWGCQRLVSSDEPLNSSSKVQVQLPLGAGTGGAAPEQVLPEAEVVAGDGVVPALVVVVVLVGVLAVLAVLGVLLALAVLGAVDVVDEDGLVMGAGCEVPVEPTTVVVVPVLALHPPSRCARGPHVDAAASL